MIEAAMDGEQLKSWREMSGLGSTEFARRLGITREALRKYEADEDVIPARFDDDVERVVDAALWEDPDPGPG